MVLRYKLKEYMHSYISTVQIGYNDNKGPTILVVRTYSDYKRYEHFYIKVIKCENVLTLLSFPY